MSHFVGLVFGTDWEERLERYNENRKVEPYVDKTKAEVVANAWKNIKLYSERGVHPEVQNISTDDEAYDWYVEYWELDTDADGNITSIHNPESKWDWYEIGGRWKGYLPLKDGKCADQCRVNDVDWMKYYEEYDSPFCIIPPGRRMDRAWHDGMVGSRKQYGTARRLEYTRKRMYQLFTRRYSCHGCGFSHIKQERQER